MGQVFWTLQSHLGMLLQLDPKYQIKWYLTKQMILKLFSEKLHFEIIFNLCEVILSNEWSFDTSSHRLQSNYWFSSTNGSTKHCVHSVWQPQCVKYFWGPLNANLLCSGMYVRSTDTRNSVLSCLNKSNAFFFFFSESDFGWQQD